MGLEFDKVSKEFSSFRAVDCVNYTMKKGVTVEAARVVEKVDRQIIFPTKEQVRWMAPEPEMLISCMTSSI